MSLAALTWAFNQDLVPAQKVVLLAIADYADDTGKCWPGQETLTRKTSLSVRSIRHQIRALEEGGLLLTIERRKEGGARATNAYQLAFGLPADIAGSDSQPARHAEHNRHAVAGIAEPSEEPSDTPIVPTEDDLLFQSVWNVWPKKVAESTARSEWRKIPKMERETRAEQLIIHAKAHARHTPKEFLPRLSVYIRDTRWNEPLPTPRAPQRSAGPVRKAPTGVHQNAEWMYQ